MPITIALVKLQEAVLMLKMDRDKNKEIIQLIEAAMEELQETWGRTRE
jgi:hypothetical protein